MSDINDDKNYDRGEREDFHYNADNVDDGGGRGHDNYDEVEVADDG